MPLGVLFIKVQIHVHQIDILIILNKQILIPQLQKNFIRNNSYLIVNFNVATLIMHQKSYENVYDLYLRVDTNTKGHTQWYYFSVKNKKSVKVTFNIYRFSKTYSLYQKGMKPYVLSKKQYQSNKTSWRQQGTNVKYSLQKNQLNSKKYILSFEYQFKYDFDQVFFAACPPYSYSFLNEQLQYYNQKFPNNFLINKNYKSLGGLILPHITIKFKIYFQNITPKFIVIIGRTHPGQSSGSWVIDGIIESLVDLNTKQFFIKKNIIFKIVPMMNPDGVFIGNYRTGIIGMDFNRNFNTGSANHFPEIYSLKKMMYQLKKEGEILGFIDIHGHSFRKNSFIYGPQLENYLGNNLIEFPHKLSSNSNLFNINLCRFKNQKQKIQTARVFFQMKFNLLSYTIQNSLGLYFNKSKTVPTSIQDWRKFGKDIIKVLSQISSYDIKDNRLQKLKSIQFNHIFHINQQQKQEISVQQRKSFKKILKKQKYFQNNIQENKNKEVTNKNQKEQINIVSLQKSKMQKKQKNTEYLRVSQLKNHKRIINLSSRVIQNENVKQLSQQKQIFDQMNDIQQQKDYNDQDSSSQDLNQQQLIPVYDMIQKMAQINNQISDQIMTKYQQVKQKQTTQTQQKKNNTQYQLTEVSPSIFMTRKFKQIKLDIKNQSPKPNRRQINYKEFLRNIQDNSKQVKKLNANTAKLHDDKSNKIQIISKPYQQLVTQFSILKTKQLIKPIDFPIKTSNVRTTKYYKVNTNQNTKKHFNIDNSKTPSNLYEKIIRQQNLDFKINNQMSKQLEERIQFLKQKRKSIFNQKSIFQSSKKDQKITLTDFYNKKKN